MSHVMKVLHVIQSMDPAGGGPPMVAARLAAAQATLRCQVQVISYRFPGSDARIAAALSTIPEFSGVKLEYFARLTKPELFLTGGARRRFEPIVQRFDLIHLHGVWGPLVYAIGALAAKLRKPFVLTPHGMLDPWSLAQKRWKKRLALTLGYRHMLNSAAFLHFLNADECALAKRLGLTSPGRIIPNGIFLQELDPLPERGVFRAAQPEFARTKLVLFLSRLHYKKGLDFLADAFAVVARNFPDAHLIVAGPDDGARAAFESQIARLGIAPRVHLVGSPLCEPKARRSSRLRLLLSAQPTGGIQPRDHRSDGLRGPGGDLYGMPFSGSEGSRRGRRGRTQRAGDRRGN